MPELINNINQISKHYDIFILDQWGVMHDGLNGFDHAKKAIEYLFTENKKLIIVSNSSKRKKSSLNSLKKFGFEKKHFIEVMTSGEMIWRELSYSINNYGQDLKNCFHIYDSSKEDGLDFRIGLNKFNFVSNVKDANFILACTPFVNSKPLDYIPILKDALNLNLTMFCANPDYVTIDGDNKKKIFCMGTIADLYDHMGGRVVILGKPSREIYVESCKKIKNLDFAKIVAIGDSIAHDIKGAKNFGIDSVLITSGIHNDLFENINETAIKNRKKLNCNPTYLCNNFSS